MEKRDINVHIVVHSHDDVGIFKITNIIVIK